MSYEKALRTAIDAALEAGELLRREFHRWGGPLGHSGHADADEQAEWIIRNRVLAAFPDHWFRGEETGSVQGTDSHVWIVDPNDGTSAYLRGARGSAVSIALIRDGVPVLGLVYAMVTPDDRGDLIYWAEGFELTRNGVPVKPNWDVSQRNQVVLLLSLHRDHVIGTALDIIQPFRYRALPSIAYRLALAAVGDGTAALSWHTTNAWDYAAGHALIRGAGGMFANDVGQDVTYGPDGFSMCNLVFGGAPAVVRDLVQRDWKRIEAARHQQSPPSKSYIPSTRPVPGKAVASPDLLSRAQGALLGQCAGDALGQQVEFQSSESIRRIYPQGLRKMQDGGAWGTIAGQVTDDSELALLLARSIAHHNGYNREKVAAAYHYWYDRAQPFDVGNTIRKACNSVTSADVEAGRSAEAMIRGASRESQANGSLMRISPLGIFGYRKKDQLLWQLAEMDSELTHPHPVCRQACALFVTAIARAVRTGDSRQRIYDYILSLAASNSVEATLLEALKNAAESVPDANTNSGWVLVAFQNAFHQLLYAPSFEDGVVNTVMLGGDTDTNAAIAGALLGAVYGRDAVPLHWTQMLLSCRPDPAARVEHPRPQIFWPIDLPLLAELLIVNG